jgi:solute carrier family 35 protein F1/2
MASKNSETKTTAVETHAIGNGESYRKSNGLEGNAENGDYMTAGRRVNSRGEEVDGEVLEHAIEALEKKKTAWYAYLLTKDFWLVLLIGYVCFPTRVVICNVNLEVVYANSSIDKSSPCA